ncbi:MAG TPA: transglutaminase family protein [Chthoniobacterales bacterium]|nr:transglutaminase family protein [Chthoniobacterales bacterium]
MKLGLRYQTTYRYEEPVGFFPHELRLFPRSDRFSRVRRLDFSTTPKATIRYSRDVFENTVASCYFPERSRELTFRLAINLDLDEKDPFHFLLGPDAIELPFVYGARTSQLLAAYRERHVKEQLTLPGWGVPTARKRRGTVETLVDLNKRLHECIGYERREQGEALSPLQTLGRGRGACRDVAVLLAEMLRQMGLAARLTSGYLRESDAETKRSEGSLHAWTEVFLPGAGWVGLDATNGVFCNHNFIGAAVGLTPADITPISGAFYHPKGMPGQMTSRLELINL